MLMEWIFLLAMIFKRQQGYQHQFTKNYQQSATKNQNLGEMKENDYREWKLELPIDPEDRPPAWMETAQPIRADSMAEWK